MNETDAKTAEKKAKRVNALHFEKWRKTISKCGLKRRELNVGSKKERVLIYKE